MNQNIWLYQTKKKKTARKYLLYQCVHLRACISANSLADEQKNSPLALPKLPLKMPTI